MEGENNEGDEMGIWKPSEAELLSVATLKWSGITTANGEPTMGAWVAEMDFGTSPAVKNRLLTAINTNQQLVDAQGGVIHLSASIGGHLSRVGEPLDSILLQGDMALYAAKAAGRNCYKSSAS